MGMKIKDSKNCFSL